MMWNVLPHSEVAQEPGRPLTAGPRRIPMVIRGGESTRWAGPVAGVLALAGMVLVAVVIFVAGRGPENGKLPELAKDNTCQMIELENTAVGYETSVRLPADAADLLVVDIARTDDDQPEHI